MNFTLDDFKRFRWNLLVLLVCLAAGVSIVWLAYVHEQSVQRELRQALTQQADVQAKLARAKDEEQELLSKIGRYQEIEQRGHFAPEQRLDWVEHIQRIKQERRLFEIQYELSPQKPLDQAVLPAGATAGNFEFLFSPMQVRMQLLHEEDLLHFIGDLQRSVKAYLRHRACTVERIPRGSERNTQAQLNATCSLDWVTLRERK